MNGFVIAANQHEHSQDDEETAASACRFCCC